MNVYLTAIGGMSALLDCADEKTLSRFRKKDYKDTFEELVKTHAGTFAALEEGYNSVMDKDQYLSNMADALIEEAQKRIQDCPKKSRRESLQINLNLAMVAYVFPMILKTCGNSSKPLTDLLVEKWNTAFPHTTIAAAPYEEIEAGFHRKFCYVTTAASLALGKGEHCPELNLLREYRDTFLVRQPWGEAWIDRYYDIAPSIVKHIEQREDAGAIFQQIWSDYVCPCIEMIRHQKKEQCAEHYRRMVEDLEQQYFLSTYGSEDKR